MYNEKKCPNCNSQRLIKRGLTKGKFRNKQRYGCKNCHKRFVLDIKNIKGNAKLVTLAMDCYFKGLSYRDISDQFSQFYGMKIHHETIRRWVLRFSKVLNEYSKTLQPKTSGVWNADETLILTKRGINKNKSHQHYDYVWNVIDNESKFLLASVNSGRKRNSKEAQEVFKEAWKQNVKMPNQIIVDGYKGYQDGCRKTFRNWGNERKVKFTSIKGRRKWVNNNAIESHHTHQKEFHKIRRGVKEVQTYQDGFRTFHNFIRKNIKDNLTPAEKCNLMIPSQNRWMGMLNKNVQEIKSLNNNPILPENNFKHRKEKLLPNL